MKGDRTGEEAVKGAKTYGGSRTTCQDVDLGRFKQLLLEKKAQVDKSFEDIKSRTFSVSLKESSGEDSSCDQHSADLALSTFERGKDLGLKDDLEIDRTRISLALDRLHKGTYGYCLRCGRPIPEGRLAAMPEAELCVPCQEEETRPASRRPVEEQRL